jgi:hypothetical protein
LGPDLLMIQKIPAKSDIEAPHIGHASRLTRARNESTEVRNE